MRWVLIILICFFQYTLFSLAASLDPVKIEKLSKSKQWFRLLHYKHSFPFGGVKSEIASGEFFFAPHGSHDPPAELLASAEAFGKDLKVGKLKQHPQCAFPLRYRFLKRELGLSTSDVPCPQFQEFLDRINAESVTLVFSSAYPNNPGSMFGHTFLRINAKPGPSGKKLDLLDMGINYAAMIGDDSGFLFAILGIFGGYYGEFSLTPYYVKVNEYNHSESRDVWEYDLNLNAEETWSLLAHAWEVESNANFRYYFFDENCSYVLMRMLEAAKPDWDISGFPLYVIPSETIKKVVAIPGAVTGVRFRASLRKKMFRRYQGLSPAQRSQLYALIDRKLEPGAVGDIPVIEAAESFFYYQKQKVGPSEFPPESQTLLRALLVRRSQLGRTAAPSKTDAEEDRVAMGDRYEGATRPDRGHDSFQLGTSGGIQSETSTGSGPRYFQELQFKLALHDLMNDDQGYAPFSQMDFPSIVLRYTAGGQAFNVEDINFVAITSLFPFNFLERAPSWKLGLDYFSPKDSGCPTCHALRLQGGPGLTLEVGSRYAILYVLALADVEAGSSFGRAVRFGPKAETAFLWNPIEIYKLRASWDLSTDLLQSYRQKIFHQLEFEQSLAVARQWDLRARLIAILPTADSTHRYKEAKLTLNHYF